MLYHLHSWQFRLTGASRSSRNNIALAIHQNNNHELPDSCNFFSNSLSRDKETDEKDSVCKALGENQKVT